VSTPVALQPLAANDGRTPRSVYFTTKSGAESYARRQARAESPTNTITGVPFVSGLFRPVEGGKAFEVRLAQFGDFEVREVTEFELVRRQQAGMRAEVERRTDEAARWQADGDKSRMGSVRAEFHRYARECRERAREIETQLTIAGVRQVGAEPITSSERDSREAASR
jgi:hypothetical protein